MKKKNVYKMAAAITFSAVLMGQSIIIPAFAAASTSPEFAYDEQKWASLRDNIMEYGEIEDLIHEYNATVINNRISYDDYRGKTKEDVSRSYSDAADEIGKNINYPDSDSPVYAILYASAATSEIQEKNLRMQADNNIDDGAIVKLQYEMAEASLASNAQTMMNSYNQLLVSLDTLKKNREVLSAVYDSTVTKASLGLATNAEVLTAQENIQTLDASIASVEGNIQTTRQNLCVMLGWSYNASPEIQAIPASDLSRIDAMNPEADKQKALDNNYTLKINKRKLLNATSSNTMDSLKKTIADNEQKIASSVATQYQAVLLAKTAYEQAKAELALEERNMQTADRQYSIGTISKLEYLNVQSAYLEKQINEKTADMALFQAMETYDWYLRGLAQAS